MVAEDLHALLQPRNGLLSSPSTLPSAPPRPGGTTGITPTSTIQMREGPGQEQQGSGCRRDAHENTSEEGQTRTMRKAELCPVCTERHFVDQDSRGGPSWGTRALSAEG